MKTFKPYSAASPINRQLRQARLETDLLKVGIGELQSYLTSPKFHQDTTVQVTDVLARLRETLNGATDAVYEIEAIFAREGGAE